MPASMFLNSEPKYACHFLSGKRSIDKQTKGLQFVPHKIPIDKYGRWLTIDVSDYNHDGFPDVILGNFSMWGSLNNQKDLKPDWDTHEPLIVLKNISKKKR